MVELGFSLRHPDSILLSPLPRCLVRVGCGGGGSFGPGSVWGPVLPSGGPAGLRMSEVGLEVTECGRREAKKYLEENVGRVGRVRIGNERVPSYCHVYSMEE